MTNEQRLQQLREAYQCWLDCDGNKVLWDDNANKAYDDGYVNGLFHGAMYAFTVGLPQHPAGWRLTCACDECVKHDYAMSFPFIDQ